MKTREKASWWVGILSIVFLPMIYYGLTFSKLIGTDWCWQFHLPLQLMIPLIVALFLSGLLREHYTASTGWIALISGAVIGLVMAAKYIPIITLHLMTVWSLPLQEYWALPIIAQVCGWTIIIGSCFVSLLIQTLLDKDETKIKNV